MSTTQKSSNQFVNAHPVGFGQAKWTRGFWADRFACCRDVMVPTMGAMMTDTERYRYVGNFEVAIGAVEGRHRGPKWNDGDFYKWLESAAAVYGATKDPKLDAQMDQLIEVIGKAQEPDGYIHTDVQIAQRAGDAIKRFGNPMDFEMYNMGHLMSVACVHHRATGKTTLLAIARKAADFLAGVFAKPTPEMARHGICPAHLMGLIDLYRTTVEKRYLDLSITLLNMRDLVTKGDDDNQDRIPFRKQTTAHGHAVRATYLYAGAADIYAETGDKTLLDPLQLIWQDLVSRKLYITGGCGALFDGASPDGSIDQANITRTHQSFGRNYQLPQSTAHNETCAAIGNVFWNWRMFQITGEARFADIIELTLFNSVLAGISIDGTAFFYTNTLRQLNPMPVELRWPQTRQKSLGCFCCPPNVLRTIAQASNYAYAASDRGVYVVLYGASQLDTTLANGTRVKLTQETDYPWDGKIRFTIQSAGEFSLMLRIPNWAQSTTINVNGKAHGSAVGPGFHEIRKVWSVGDIVDLDLPMPVRLIEAHPLVEEARNHVAITRGPIVYCLESVDLPKDIRLLDVLIPRDAQFKPTPMDELLPEMMALSGGAKAISRPDSSDALYRDLASSTLRDINVRLIPYFAWDNRGTTEMSVWLPLMR